MGKGQGDLVNEDEERKEQIIIELIRKYLGKNNLMSNYQHEFVQKDREIPSKQKVLV